ncbi:unnamed protein product [Phytomonas sp. EM1]|nr:unnamed protein product [Phytomonas sp. EM1]|eukprot:CCW65789.1 unnamed protein product [Phytomonas sp. isolate EM1]
MAGKRGEVWVTEYDPHTGRIALERRSPSHRWGLVFDGAGLLVGIENALRNGSEAGERLYYALQQSKGAAGMAVLQVNRRRIRTANLTAAELESKRREILGRLTDCLRGDGRTLQMVVEKKNHAELTAAREVFFEASQQGGERGVGQQVLFILERAAPTIPWGLKLAALPDTPPLLTNFSDKLQLSKKAKNFLFDHRGRLRVVSVNYRDTHRHFTTEQLKQYMSESLLLALWLQVADPPSEGIEDASFFGDGQSPREAAEDPASSLGAGEAYKAPTKAVDKGADKIRLGHEETTERSAGDVIDRDTNLVGDKKGLRGADALDPEVDDWTIEKDLLSEQEDDTPEDVQNGSPELDAELAEYDALEKELESFSAMEDLEEAREVPDEGLPDESDSAELQGAETEETSPEADVSAAKSNSKKDKVTSKKDKKSKKTPKSKKKSSTNERKKSSKRGEATTLEDENDAIDEDGISREEIDEAIEPSGVGNPKTLNDRNAAADTPLIEPKPTSAEIAMRVAEEARHNASDSSKTRKSKSSKDPEALERDAAPGEDAPLVDSLKTSAEVAMEAAGRGGVNGEMPAVTPSAPSDAATAENASVSITQLLATPPLRFDNEVIANKFDGKVLELSRPSTEVPWNIKMAFVGDEVLLSKLPSVGNGRKDHPYLRYLGAMPDGNVRCSVESMNGVDLLMASKVEKAKLMDAVKKSTKLSMILKVLR